MTVSSTQVGGRPTIPWSWYSDPSILALEIERIFRCSWQYAGHLGELQGPSSYFASETGPVPIVITLDADGKLRALVNVCRHRGALVAVGAGKRGTLQCPYHAWTYGLDGRLRAAPRGDAVEITLPINRATRVPFSKKSLGGRSSPRWRRAVRCLNLSRLWGIHVLLVKVHTAYDCGDQQ